MTKCLIKYRVHYILVPKPTLCYASEQGTLECAGHNYTKHWSGLQKMAKEVAGLREKVLNNIAQQKSAYFFLCESYGIFRSIS